VGFFSQRGAPRAGSAGRNDTFEAAISDAAQASAEIAQSANVISESIRFRLASQAASADGEPQPDGRVGELADALAETAAELQRRALSLSRALGEEALPQLELPVDQRPALRSFAPVPGAPPPSARGDDDAVSDGLRVIVTKMLSDGWSDQEAAYYLWSELGIRDSHAVVAQVVERASHLDSGLAPAEGGR
jgi:hypothetical protein